MDNTVGSPSAGFCNFPKSIDDYHILGLWCADGYHWTSSIGLSSIDLALIQRFREFLSKLFSKDRIKLGQYTTGKRKYVGYKLYVNCRALLRIFKVFKENSEIKLSDTEVIKAYIAIAGRFDGDGCISRNLKRDCRISYGNYQDAKFDYDLLNEIGIARSKLYRYRTSNTHVIYISMKDVSKFLESISKHSIKLQKLVLGSRRDSDYTEIIRMATNTN